MPSGPDNCMGWSKSGSVGKLRAAIDILCYFAPNQEILIFVSYQDQLSIQNVQCFSGPRNIHLPKAKCVPGLSTISKTNCCRAMQNEIN